VKVGAGLLANVGRRVGLFSGSSIISTMRGCSIGAKVEGGNVGALVESTVCSTGAIDGNILGDPVFSISAAAFGATRGVVPFALLLNK